jgi:hypothetical protein
LKTTILAATILVGLSHNAVAAVISSDECKTIHASMLSSAEFELSVLESIQTITALGLKIIVDTNNKNPTVKSSIDEILKINKENLFKSQSNAKLNAQAAVAVRKACREYLN